MTLDRRDARIALVAATVLALVTALVLPLATRARAVDVGRDAGTVGTETLAQAKRRLGYFVVNPQALAASKAAAADDAADHGASKTKTAPARSGTSRSSGGSNPSWEGVAQNDLAPPDATGAMGPSSYVEAINLQLAVYGRNGGLVSKGTFGGLTGVPDDPVFGEPPLSDPQVLWDGHTQRFYYSIADTLDNTIRWGFSLTAAPTNAQAANLGAAGGAWCSYTADFGYGASFPDYPKLGQTTDFLLIGANVFVGPFIYAGSDIDWIAKPQAVGTLPRCPAEPLTGFPHGRQPLVLSGDGSPAFTPQPAKQAGWSPVGWVAAAHVDANGNPGGDTIELFRITKNADGTANIPARATASVTVNPSDPYKPPAAAPQRGSAATLDTLDGRFLNAVIAVDPRLPAAAAGPSRGLWIAHAAARATGKGSEARWYEVNVDSSPPSLFQSGKVTSTSLAIFNPAISDDRAATGATVGSFGSDMVIGVTTSSSSTYPAVAMAAKVGANAQTGLATVHASSVPDNGFDCADVTGAPLTCRWGDYSGASPDPGAPTSSTVGRVWLSNMFAERSTSASDLQTAEWGTWNWEATP